MLLFHIHRNIYDGARILDLSKLFEDSIAPQLGNTSLDCKSQSGI